MPGANEKRRLAKIRKLLHRLDSEALGEAEAIRLRARARFLADSLAHDLDEEAAEDDQAIRLLLARARLSVRLI